MKGIKLTDLPGSLRKQVEFQIAKATRNRIAVSPSNVEQDTGHAPVAEKETPRFTTPCRIHFHSIRKRLADIDGLSGKACIDGLVKGNLLSDDSPKEVKEVIHTQEKGEPERTIITITEANQ